MRYHFPTFVFQVLQLAYFSSYLSHQGKTSYSQIKNQRQIMPNICSARFLCQINPQNHNIQQFYDPLTPTQLIKKKIPTVKASSCFRTLFDDEENQQNIFDKFEKQSRITKDSKEQETGDDFFIKKIIANTKNPTRKITPTQIIPSHQPHFQPYSFDKKTQVKYPQTPHFKNQLLSPFWKFNKDNKYNIETLQKNFNKAGNCEFLALELQEDPLFHVTEPVKYFIGLGLKMKEKELVAQCMMFFKLACYAQAYNEKAWRKYIQFVDQAGDIRKTFILSKTAFLFCPTQELAKSYISNGQKCGISIDQLRGVITNISNPDLFEKGILVEIGKLCIKYKQSWKGLKILFEICIWNQFKLPVCLLIHFLARTLDNLGQTEKALTLLKKSFGKTMSKLQIYTLYLQMKNREQKGAIKETTIKQVLDFSDSISGQNKYKLYLEVAEILFKQRNPKYQHFLQQSYFAAKNFCALGTGCNKALRHIFLSVLKWKKVIYPLSVQNDITVFETNRQRYVTGEKLLHYEFSDWKFYLHYGLEKRDDILGDAMRKRPYTGRLIAQWIHCLRSKRPVIEVLRIWRQKIRQVPKSGQLWCQGGRMYAQLKDYENASRCFRAAIHFTPQYGDSFFEELRILLIKGKFRQIQKLKKIMCVSEPFYGHVWSYLRSFEDCYKFSLANMWEVAMEEIKLNLYEENTKVFRIQKPYSCERLTAVSNYNKAVENPMSQQIRVRLFYSYEQMESRS